MTFNSLSLKYRIAAVIFILEAVMMLMVLSLTFSNADNLVQEQVKNTEATIIDLISNLSRAAFIIDEYDDLQPYVEQAIQAPHIDRIMIMDRHGVVLVSSHTQDIGRYYDQLVNTNPDWKERAISNATGYIGKIAIKYSHAQLQEATKHSFTIGTTAAIIGMLIIALIGVLSGTLLTRRLQTVANTAKTMSAGNLEARTNLNGSDEVGELGHAFDDMAEKLNTQIRSLKQREQELDNAREQLEQRVRKRTEELANARDEAIKANQAKSAFLATISHEIRTPMTAIIGFAELLREDNITADDRNQSTEAILTSGNHLLQLITDVLDIAKIEADKLETDIQPIAPQDLITPIASIVKPIAQKNSVTFRCEQQSELPELINTDAIRLKQALLNLINNAIKFTQNGSVTLKVNYSKLTDLLTLEVIDTGIGMTEQELTKIFNKFEQADSSITRKFGGTGLGLALTKELIHLLGGNISVRSEYGVGSHFTVKLPCRTQTAESNWNQVSPENEEAQNSSYSDEEPALLEGKVLVVEDTEILRIMTEKTIQRTGAKTVSAVNGQDALEKIKAQHFDLIFMDMQMPIMDGITAVQHIREQSIETPIVMLTANVLKTDQIRCLEAGCDDFISKPVTKQAIYSILRKHLNIVTASKMEEMLEY